MCLSCQNHYAFAKSVTLYVINKRKCKPGKVCELKSSLRKEQESLTLANLIVKNFRPVTNETPIRALN
jgi:hypothetical protein